MTDDAWEEFHRGIDADGIVHASFFTSPADPAHFNFWTCAGLYTLDALTATTAPITCVRCLVDSPLSSPEASCTSTSSSTPTASSTA